MLHDANCLQSLGIQKSALVWTKACIDDDVSEHGSFVGRVVFNEFLGSGQGSAASLATMHRTSVICCWCIAVRAWRRRNAWTRQRRENRDKRYIFQNKAPRVPWFQHMGCRFAGIHAEYADFGERGSLGRVFPIVEALGRTGSGAQIPCIP